MKKIRLNYYPFPLRPWKLNFWLIFIFLVLQHCKKKKFLFEFRSRKNVTRKTADTFSGKRKELMLFDSINVPPIILQINIWQIGMQLGLSLKKIGRVNILGNFDLTPMNRLYKIIGNIGQTFYFCLLFQAMALLRKALVASFIASPKTSANGETKMKSTENRRKRGNKQKFFQLYLKEIEWGQSKEYWRRKRKGRFRNSPRWKRKLSKSKHSVFFLRIYKNIPVLIFHKIFFLLKYRVIKSKG